MKLNQEFMDTLFLGDNNYLLPAHKSKQRKLDIEVDPPINPQSCPKDPFDVQQRIRRLYPCRDKEICTIINFLSNDIFSTPTLFVTGLEGVGKSAICLQCVQEMSSIYCVLNLALYSDMNQFLYDAWIRILMALEGNPLMKKIKKDLVHNVFGIRMPPKSLSDLQSLVVDLLDSLNSPETTSSSSTSSPPIFLHVLFDNAEHASKLHATMLPWILRFAQGDGRNKICASPRPVRIKVLVLSKAVGVRNGFDLPVIQLPFRAYTSSEMEQILISISKNKLSDDELSILQTEHWQGFRSLVKKAVGAVVSTSNPESVLYSIERSKLVSVSPVFGSLRSSLEQLTVTPTGEREEDDWTLHMSPVQKVWLLAAYVATHIKPSEDRYLLAHVRKSKRKVPAAAAVAAETNGADHVHTVTIERLINAGTLVARNCSDVIHHALPKAQLVKELGNPASLAVIGSCVECGLLARSSGSSVNQRIVCHVSEDMATKLAKSLGFPVSNYVF